MEEIKNKVFSTSIFSAPGPDRISRKFYQSYWKIIKEDLLLIVLEFFAGTEIQKAFTHTYLTLIPKVEHS